MVEIADTAGWTAKINSQATRPAHASNWISPPASGAASGGHYYIDIELPGVRMEDIEIILDNDKISLRGAKTAPQRDSETSYFFSEIETGQFQRTFRLPPDVDPGAIEASFDDGILLLRIPRTASPSIHGRKIPIQRRVQSN